jgi:hypothetical protein
VKRSWSASPSGTPSSSRSRNPRGKAYPGHPLEAIHIGSGSGYTTFLLEEVGKALLHGSFQIGGSRSIPANDYCSADCEIHEAWTTAVRPRRRSNQVRFG